MDFVSRRFWVSEIWFGGFSNSSVGSNDHQNRPLPQFEIPNFAKPTSEIPRAYYFGAGSFFSDLKIRLNDL